MSSSEEKKAAAGAGKPKTNRERLNEYFQERERQGLGVPQSSNILGHPSQSFIAKETGISINMIEKHRELIFRWVAKIGLGEPVEPINPYGDWTQQRQVQYERMMGLYLDDLRRKGKSVPEDPVNPGKTDLEKISDESGVPLFDLRRASPARNRLLEGVAELGLRAYSDPTWRSMTYRELLEEGGEIRRGELSGRPRADQQFYNTKSALRRLMKKTGRAEDNPIGPELLADFEETVKKIISEIEEVTTRRKFSSEIRRWPKLHRQVLVARGCPRKFHIALREAIKWSGLDFQRIAERAGCTDDTIRDWLNRRRDPSKESLSLVARVEEVLDLPLKTLTALIPRRCSRRLKREDYPEFAVIDGEQIMIRDKHKLLSKLKPVLPDNFPERSMAERQEMINWLCANLIGPTSSWGYLNRLFSNLPYLLKKFPADLEAEITLLTEFKTVNFLPQGQQRNGTWSDDSVIARRSALGSIFGALALPSEAEDSRLRGLGLDPASFCMAMLACSDIMVWWVNWKGNRRKDPNDQEAEAKYSFYEVEVVNFIGSLFTKETGWLRQNPQLVENLRPIPGFIDEAFIERARNDWNAVCDVVHKYYSETLSADVKAKAEEIRDPFEPILPILESDNPIAALKTFARNIFEDRPDFAVAPVQAARAMRNYMIVRIVSATALRCKNLCELTYRDDNTGQLRREGVKWVVEIPYKRFKNKNSSFFGVKKKHNYRRILEDVDGLHQRLEEYVTLHRPILLGGVKSDVFFISSQKRPEFKRLRFHELYRRLTILYLAENKYLGHGIPGVKPHGPHAVRDIIATFIVRTTGSFELAAYALADSVDLMKEHYARFLPQDKAHLADKLLVEAWVSG